MYQSLKNGLLDLSILLFAESLELVNSKWRFGFRTEEQKGKRKKIEWKKLSFNLKMSKTNTIRRVLPDIPKYLYYEGPIFRGFLKILGI